MKKILLIVAMFVISIMSVMASESIVDSSFMCETPIYSSTTLELIDDFDVVCADQLVNINGFKSVTLRGNGQDIVFKTTGSLFTFDYAKTVTLQDVTLDCKNNGSILGDDYEFLDRLVIKDSTIKNCAVVGGRINNIQIENSKIVGATKIIQDNNYYDDGFVFEEDMIFEMDDVVIDTKLDSDNLFYFYKMKHEIVSFSDVEINVDDSVKNYQIFVQAINGEVMDFVIDGVEINNHYVDANQGAPFIMTQVDIDNFIMTDVDVNTRSKSDGSLWIALNEYSNVLMDDVSEDVFVLFMGNDHYDGDETYSFSRNYPNKAKVEFEYGAGEKLQAFQNPGMSEPNFIVSENEFKFNKDSNSYDVAKMNPHAIDFSKKSVLLTFYVDVVSSVFSVVSKFGDVILSGLQSVNGEVSFDVVASGNNKKLSLVGDGIIEASVVEEIVNETVIEEPQIEEVVENITIVNESTEIVVDDESLVTNETVGEFVNDTDVIEDVVVNETREVVELNESVVEEVLNDSIEEVINETVVEESLVVPEQEEIINESIEPAAEELVVEEVIVNETQEPVLSNESMV